MSYLLGVLLLMFAWLQPLHVMPWMSWHSEIPGFLAIILLASSVLTKTEIGATRTVRVPFSTLALVALAGILIIQSALGLIGFLGDLVVIFLYLVTGILAMCAGFAVTSPAHRDLQQQQRTRSDVHFFALSVLIAAACSVVLALVQALAVWEGAEWINRTAGFRRPGANLGQPNQLATLLVMGLASLALLFESGKLRGAIAYFLFGLLILGVAITESRSGVLSAMAMVWWWLVRRRSTELRTPMAAILVGCLLLFLFLWSWPAFVEYFQAGGVPSESKYVGVSVSAGTRLVVWPQLIDAVLQRPWFGWGLREVSTAHNAVLHAYASSEPFTYAHNIVLDLAIGMGVPLTLLLVTLTAVWLTRRIRSTHALLPWYCVALLLPIGVHSLFEFPFAYSYFLFPALFAVGMLEGLIKPAATIVVSRVSAAVGLCLLMIVMAWSVWEYILLEEDFRVARFEVLRIGDTPVGHERPVIFLLSQLDAMTEVSRMVPAPGMDAENIELVRKVALRFPWFATQNRYALSLALNGNPDEAIRQLQVMRVMHGEAAFRGIRAHWMKLADDKYPQLKQLKIP
jgi:O-antigen ligase